MSKFKTSTSLVIVESPAKCSKIESYLGPGYKCIASFGHLRELKSLKSIDIENNFEPKYEVMDDPRKKKQIELLRKEIANADEVILATDDDREGEAIAWHICSLFNLPIETTKRIIFHEITENAIIKAITNPTIIDMQKVHSQQSRQILDLLVGFSISPLLWKYISKNAENSLSAGRCQTPALKIVYDNQKEINNTQEEKVYNTIGYFTSKCIPFELNKQFSNHILMNNFLENSPNFSHVYSRNNPEKIFKQPPEPLTTSRIQQISSNEMHISPKETMQICQSLYECGYITYMRTDSKKYSEDFIDSVKKYILQTYNLEKFINPTIEQLSNSKKDIENTENMSEKNDQSKKPKKTKTKSTKATKSIPLAQEAHEAIRPTSINVHELPEKMSSREKKLYKLIWEISIESCMASAEYYSFNSTIKAYDNSNYFHTSELLDFFGWKIVKNKDSKNKEREKNELIYHFLLQLKQNSIIYYKRIVSKVTLKGVKSHYTEAKLVQTLEDYGIGRPSTFSMLVDKIQERGYVKKQDVRGKQISCKDFELDDDTLVETNTVREFGNEKNKLVIQPTGILVMDFLEKNFSNIFNYDYTKSMEDNLDKICKGEMIWYELCDSCFKEINSNCEKILDEKKCEIKIDDTHFYMIGKYGPIIKCIEKVNDKEIVTFKKVKEGIDIDRLKNGSYSLEEVVSSEIKKNELNIGIYQDENLVLKKGKFGMYVTWGSKSKSLSCFGNRPLENIKLEDIIDILEKGDAEDVNETSGSNIVRFINGSISVRKSKYGDYLFYKTVKMKKPMFLKLDKFPKTLDYVTCNKDVLFEWIKTEHNISI